MNRNVSGALLTITILLSSASSPQAQQTSRIPKLGLLRTGSPPDPLVDIFRGRLHELGYVEGKNIIIETRWAEGKSGRLPELAAELVLLNVGVIIASGNSGIRAAKNATETIPIIMASVGDPVGLGFVASLARPGGNITGFSQMSPDLSGKRMELLKEILPKITRVAFVRNPDNPGMTLRFSEAQSAASVMGIKLFSLDIRSPNELPIKLSVAVKDRIDALMVPAPMAELYEKQIAEFSEKTRLPWSCDSTESVEHAGCLTAYGPSYPDLYRRTAVYLDKILKGAKPQDLPVEQPMKFEFVINLKTAKQIGVTIPPNVLARADRVIR